MTTIGTVINCAQCFGRGYVFKGHKNRQGGIAKNCPACNGTGQKARKEKP